MIPITKPDMSGSEEQLVTEVLRSGWLTQGPRVKALEDAFAQRVGARFACAVSSCTTALHLGLRGVGVRPGNIVVTVSHSFIATANAVRYCNAEPVFVDVDPLTFNMDPSALEEFLAQRCERRGDAWYLRDVRQLACGESPLTFVRESEEYGRVAAVMPVHQMGMPCAIASIVDVAGERGLPVVEDAACAIGSEYSRDGGESWEPIGRPHGDVCCFSFHPRKVITTGDGGMLTTAREDLDRAFRLWRQHGMDVSDTVRHGSKQVVFERYVTTAYNYRLSDIQAAVGISQLERLDSMLERRRRVDQMYRAGLREVRWLSVPHVPIWARPNFQSYPVTLKPTAPVTRDELLQKMLDGGICCKPGIMNAHLEAPYRSEAHDLPASVAARDDVVLLPLYPELPAEGVAQVIEMLRSL